MKVKEQDLSLSPDDCGLDKMRKATKKIVEGLREYIRAPMRGNVPRYVSLMRTAAQLVGSEHHRTGDWTYYFEVRSTYREMSTYAPADMSQFVAVNPGQQPARAASPGRGASPPPAGRRASPSPGPGGQRR